jgi:diguanylate cyclase (GGDEF)-like protein
VRWLPALFAVRARRQYALALVGAIAAYALERALPAGEVRTAVADLALTAAGGAAVLGVSRALRAAPAEDRPAWASFVLASAAWLASQLLRDAAQLGGLALPANAIDLGYLLAAPLFTLGLVLTLIRHGQRLALYALVLDVGAILLVLVAGITLFLVRTITYDIDLDPFGTVSALLYPVGYVAATAAALSVLFGMPAEEPRGAASSLFIGIGLNAFAFTAYLPSLIQGSFVAGTVLDPMWVFGMSAIGIAGTQWIEDRERGVETGLSTAVIQFSRMALPALVALASAILIVAAHYIEVGPAALVVDVAFAIVLIVLSARAGLALFTNWRLGERERRRATQLQALYEVGLATAGELSLDDLASLVAREATLLTRTDGAMVSLAEPGNGFVIRAIHKGPLLRLRDSMGEPLRGIALEAVRSRELVVATVYSQHPESNPMLHDVIASALAVPLVAHGELVGTLTAYSSRPRIFSDETLRLVRLYAAQAAIAIANARLIAETRRLARDDDLTGVLNRRSLMLRLETELAEATRHGDIFGVVLCDLDGLKAVNDSAGHLVGNEVLRTVARVMRESARTEDVVARFGGDEFVILLPRTGLLPAQAVVSRIAARLREERYMWAGRDNPIPRVSFGISWFPEDGRSADTLLAAADGRMYEDKTRARAARDSAAGAD